MVDLHFNPELWGQHDPNKFVPERLGILPLIVSIILYSVENLFRQKFSYNNSSISDFLKTVRKLKIIWHGFHLALVPECVWE